MNEVSKTRLMRTLVSKTSI